MSILPEPVFGENNFGSPKSLSRKESVVQTIVNLFFLRPGNLPSMPTMGIDVPQYMYKTEEDLDVESLKEKIFTQCSALGTEIAIGEIQILLTEHRGQGVLLFILPITGDFSEEYTDSVLVLAFRSEAERVLYNYKFEDRNNIFVT